MTIVRGFDHQAKGRSFKHMGRERTNSSREIVRTVQLRWEGLWENVTSPFVILGTTGLGDSWGKGQETIAEGREAPALGRDSACLFPGIPA